jgi:Tol biopolymer transport system component
MARGALFCIVLAAVGLGTFWAGAQEPKTGPRGGVEGRLTWFDRQGKVLGTAGEPGLYRTLTISPDGKRVAVERADSRTQNRDIWLVEAATGAMTRFTSDPGWDAFPTWSPDGTRIIFTSNRSGVYDLYEKPADGAANETLIYHSNEGKGPTSWSPDGKSLLYYSLGQPTHVRLLSIAGPADRQPVPVVDARFTSITARFSADGQWILYTSNESGKNEISVRSFDTATGALGDAITMTTGGGRTPLWRRDGNEIFYLTPDGMVMAVEVNATKPFQAGVPKPLFQAPSGVLFWDVSADGKRFLLPVPGA